MKKLILLLLCLATVLYTQAQQKAVTETGDEVFLYEDGTWVYKNGDVLVETEILTNSKPFNKDVKSTFLLKSSTLNVGFWLNPKLWSFKKAINNTEAEYELQFKEDDLYGMVISEEIEIPLVSLRGIALENAMSIAPDLKIVEEEYRIVNDLKILFMQLDGTIQGIKFSYYGYYFSNKNGTIQFITYTSQSLLDDYRDRCENLLNGIVEID